MGIKDLLKLMKPYIQPVHIKKYAGKRVGIDAYSWLHKGAYSCSMELCLNSSGEKKLQYLKYFMHRINLLQHYNITPVVVFDGGDMPCKAATEQERHRKREANHELAMAKLKDGDTRAAAELFQRAVSISPTMAHQLIQILRSESIEFVVAPYEADAQLAYLCSLEPEKGGIAAVITEDSDLLAYCSQAVIFKMDRYGNGEEIVLDKIFNSVDIRPSFCQFNEELFIGMCVLAGCDFLPSVPGIGIAKSYSLVSKYRNLNRTLSMLKHEKGSLMPDDYPKSFREAVAVFQHAIIYDAHAKKLKHMKPLPQELLDSFGGELDFLGPNIPPSVSIAIAEGILDPVTMKAFDNLNKFGTNVNPVRPKTRKIQVPSHPAIPLKQGCFMAFPSLKTSGKDNEEKQCFSELTYKKEVDALDMLLLPCKLDNMSQKALTFDETPLKFPENNPFKKRKVDQIQLTEDKSSTCMSADDITQEVCNGYPFRKRIVGKIYLDEDMTASEVGEQVSMAIGLEGQELYATPQCSSKPNNADVEEIMEPMSCVTETENSEPLGAPLGSQESVKPVSKNIYSRKVTRAEDSRRRFSRSSESRKSSILNYFSPIN